MKEDLHEVTTFNRNKKLRTVLEMAKWPHLTIRYNSAIDARAGDFKYHTSCWVKYVDRGVDESSNVNKINYDFHEGKMKECIEFEMLQRVEYSLNNGDVLSIRSIVEEYDKALLSHNISDDCSYSRKRKIWKENILQRIPQAEIQHRISTNTPECIFQNIHKGLIIKAAIENAECQENSLKRMWSVAKREDSLSFIRSCKLEFDGGVKPESLRQPALLVSFLKWFLTGVEKQIEGERGKHLDSVVQSLADTLLYNMKTKWQVDYLPQTDVSFAYQ